MDAVYASPQGIPTRQVLPEKPSCYFRRRFFWASDFPHPDHPPEYVPEVARLVGELPESAREGFLGGNALRAFGIAASD